MEEQNVKNAVKPAPKTNRRGIAMDYIDRLRALREDNDLTQTEVADYLGTSQTMYARYERRASLKTK